MQNITLNARFYSHIPTGMQRYGLEMVKRMSGDLDVVRPSRPLSGPEGHLWEQFYLPAASRGRLLWSPNNTGPIAVQRQVCTMHDIIPVEHPEWFNPRFAAWYAWLLPRLLKRVDHLIAVSQFTKERIVEKFGVDQSKISVVWNGVDDQFRPRTEAEIDNVREALGIKSKNYILCLGSLEPRKNVPRLLQAWDLISRQLPDEVELVISGKVGASKVFSSAGLSEIPERVHFTGYVNQEQLPALYSGALALVYPSLYEGFGLPPLEAMACGTAVVTSASTSLQEVVGDAAVLVDPLDIGSIAESIVAVVENEALRHDLSKRGLERAQNFTWDRSADATREILLRF
ncbi:MAG: glycosyltransferase family 1 protein [Hyphomicrobiaceae bacterium]